MDMKQQDSMEYPTTSCSNCNSADQKATHRCMECKENLCQKCYTSHMTLNAIKDHKMIPMKDIYAGKVNLMAAKDDNICKLHKEVFKYFCVTDNTPICQDCVILKECPTEHDRVWLENAGKAQLEHLSGLVTDSADILRRYKSAAQDMRLIGSEFEINSQVAKKSLWKAEQEYMRLIRKQVKEMQDDIERVKLERVEAIRAQLKQMESCIRDVQKITMETNRFIRSGSTMQVISAHDALSKRLQELLQSPLPEVDPRLSYIKFAAAIPESISMGQLFDTGTPETRWKLIGQVRTGDFDPVYGLDVTHDDHIAVCTGQDGVKVLSLSGEVIHTLQHESSCIIDTAVTHDNRYMCIPKDESQIVIFDESGSKVETVPIITDKNELWDGNSIAVGISGKITVGNESPGISVYNSEMHLINTFPTPSKICHLAVTSYGEIVMSAQDPLSEQGSSSLQMHDHCGNNIRTIQPPAEVSIWRPGFICCWQEEIFVVNEYLGNPVGIYRYTSSGDYLGCVTNEILNPCGIALSKDRMQLFVADAEDKQIKIFQRLQIPDQQI